MPEKIDRQAAASTPVERIAASDEGQCREDVLSVERHHKEDGRLLILYKWIDSDE
jgi:hypothetical protein